MDAVRNLNKTTALIIEATQKERILNQLQSSGEPNLRWDIYTLEKVFGKKGKNNKLSSELFLIFLFLHY